MGNAKEISRGIYKSKHAIYSFENASKASKNEEQTATPIIPNPSNIDSEKTSKGEVISWGSNNDYPNKIIQLIRKLGVAGAVVSVATAAHFGTGLTLYEQSQDGKQIVIPFNKYPAFDEYNKRNRLNLFYSEFINDLEIHEMGFVEFGLSADFSKIVFQKRHDAVFCRFAPINPTTGRIEKILLNPDWTNRDDKYTSVVDCFSQYDYFEDIQEYCREKKIFKFIIPFHFVKNGSLYYNDPFWHGPLKNGWGDIVLSVPAVKKAIAENQLHIKYLIHVSEKYFEMKFGIDQQTEQPNWKSFDADRQKKEMEALIESIDEHLSGPGAYGRSLYVPMYKDREGVEHETIKIVPVDDKIKDGAYLPDATAGNSEIATAKGVDLSIIGIGIPGGQNQSGSGSDKREAYTILCANMVINRSVSLLVFYFLRDWNKWGDNLFGNFPNVVLTTLDKNPSGATSKTL